MVGVSGVLKEIYRNGGSESLALLELPESLRGEFRKYVLHPSLMDGALQSVAGMGKSGEAEEGMYLPFSLGEVEIIKPLAERCWVWVKVFQIRQVEIREKKKILAVTE